MKCTFFYKENLSYFLSTIDEFSMLESLEAHCQMGLRVLCCCSIVTDKVNSTTRQKDYFPMKVFLWIRSFPDFKKNHWQKKNVCGNLLWHLKKFLKNFENFSWFFLNNKFSSRITFELGLGSIFGLFGNYTTISYCY